MQAQLERYERRFRVLRGVLTATRTETTAEKTVAAVLSEVCNGFGWPVGLYFAAPQGNGAGLSATEVRYAHSVTNQSLVRTLHERSRDDGEASLDANIRRSRVPRWIPNVTVEPSFESTKQAVALGIRGLVGIPVQARDHLYGVFEFFTREEFNPSPDQVDYLSDLGNIAGAAVHFHEIKRRDEKTRQHHQALFEHVHDPVYIVDQAGRATFVNSSAAKLFGVSQEQILGQKMHDLYHRSTTGDGAPAADCPLHGAPARTLKTGPRRETYRIKEERAIEVEAVAAPFTVSDAQETLILLHLP